jgi:hypothetical protein
VDLGQGRAARGQLPAVSIEHSRPQRLGQAGSPVGAGTAADTEHDRRAARIEGGRDHVTGTSARGAQRLEPSVGQPAQPGDVGHLDDRQAVTARVRRPHGASSGPAGHDGHAREARRQRRREGPLSPVGDGDRDRVDAVVNGSKTADHAAGDLRRGQRALELVRCDDDAVHG